jgi:hypothetical protein
MALHMDKLEMGEGRQLLESWDGREHLGNGGSYDVINWLYTTHILTDLFLPKFPTQRRQVLWSL